MLKIIYKAEPYYSTNMLNEPATIDLTAEFGDESSLAEIIGQFIKILEFAGYPRQSKMQWLRMVDLLTDNGNLIDDEEKERE